jgi:SHS2 domain-containing protein
VCPFRLLDHPADLGIHAEGPTLAGVFADLARGLVSVILDERGIREQEERSVTLHAADREQLLVRWLSEVLYLYDGRGYVGVRFLVEDLTDTSLTVRIAGEAFDPLRHTTRLDVKAVTYHQLRIAETAEGWEAEVVVDI